MYYEGERNYSCNMWIHDLFINMVYTIEGGKLVTDKIHSESSDWSKKNE